MTKKINTTTTTEHDEQVALFEWKALQVGLIPELELLHAIPNGAKMPFSRDAKGQYFSNQAMKMVKEGLTKGIPDVCLPVARRGYHGLYIEMKRHPNKPSRDQLRIIDLLREQGYRVDICWDFEEAKDRILWYLEQL